jgi:hypothetical protein
MSLFPDDQVVAAVAEKLLSRARVGMATYGISMHAERKPLYYWIDHAIEEALDLANYLMKLKMDLESKEMTAELAADLGYEDLQHDLFAQRLR